MLKVDLFIYSYVDLNHRQPFYTVKTLVEVLYHYLWIRCIVCITIICSIIVVVPVGSVNTLWGLVNACLYRYMHICKPAKETHHHLPHMYILGTLHFIAHSFCRECKYLRGAGVCLFV